MPPSIEQLGPGIVRPGAILELTSSGAKAINVVWTQRCQGHLRKGSGLVVQAIDPEQTHLKRTDKPNAVISVPNDMDLFEGPLPLRRRECVRISTHCAGPEKRICPSESGRVAATFTAPGGAKLANAKCKACSFTETVGPASRLPSKA